jgi:hypothetical protein
LNTNDKRKKRAMDLWNGIYKYLQEPLPGFNGKTIAKNEFEKIIPDLVQ